MDPELLATLLSRAQAASSDWRSTTPGAETQYQLGQSQPGRIPSATPAVGDMQESLDFLPEPRAPRGELDYADPREFAAGLALDDLYQALGLQDPLAELGRSARPYVQPLARRAGGAANKLIAQLDESGLPASEIVRLGMQSPVLDTTVTGLDEYLTLLGEGTPEGEAVRRGFGAAFDYAREVGPEYFDMDAPPVPPRSLGDVAYMDMSPIEALLSDASVSALDLVPLVGAGAAGIRAVGRQAIREGNVVQQILESIAAIPADRIRAAPPIGRGVRKGAAFGSYDEIPQDIAEMVINTADDATRDMLANSADAQSWLTGVLSQVDQMATYFANPALETADLGAAPQRYARGLVRDYGLPREVADSVVQEVQKRARQVSQARRDNPVLSTLARIGEANYDGFDETLRPGQIFGRQFLIDDLPPGSEDIVENLKMIRDFERHGSPDYTYIMNEALDEVRENVRRVDAGLEPLTDTPALDELRFIQQTNPNATAATRAAFAPSATANRLIPTDATPEEAQELFDIVSSEGRRVAEGNLPFGDLGVDDTDEILNLMRQSSGFEVQNAIESANILDPELETLVRRLEGGFDPPDQLQAITPDDIRNLVEGNFGGQFGAHRNLDPRWQRFVQEMDLAYSDELGGVDPDDFLRIAQEANIDVGDLVPTGRLGSVTDAADMDALDASIRQIDSEVMPDAPILSPSDIAGRVMSDNLAEGPSMIRDELYRYLRSKEAANGVVFDDALGYLIDQGFDWGEAEDLLRNYWLQ